MTITKRAVIDRIEDDLHAVLLVDPNETELVVPRSTLPDEADEGMWLRIQLNGERVTKAWLDPGNTVDTKQRIQSKMDLLRQRSRR